MSSSWRAFAIAVAIFASSTPTFAGRITLVDPAGSFNLTGVQPLPKPNNDDFAAAGATSPNSIGATKTFTTLDAMLHSFDVAATGGITEYFFSERVFNQTGVDWTDFHFELIGLEEEDGLDFDTPQKTPAPKAILAQGDPMNLFNTLNHQDDTIDWSGGVVKNGQSIFFEFSIDVPDSITRFTLLERPTTRVPEPHPSTLLSIILSAGLVCLGCFGHRHLAA
jgi:hypothetical protein